MVVDSDSTIECTLYCLCGKHNANQPRSIIIRRTLSSIMSEINTGKKFSEELHVPFMCRRREDRILGGRESTSTERGRRLNVTVRDERESETRDSSGNKEGDSVEDNSVGVGSLYGLYTGLGI